MRRVAFVDQEAAVLVFFVVIALACATAVFGFTFWSYGSLVAVLLAIFSANALVFVLAVVAGPRARDGSD
jgi:hypothetical protein